MANLDSSRTTTLQLHFDFLSRRALLSVNGKDYVLPDSYQNKEMAQIAAQKFAWEKLGFRKSAAGSERPVDLPILHQ
jgi:hypothetical protein